MTAPLTRRQALIGLAATAVLAGCRTGAAPHSDHDVAAPDLTPVEDRHGARIGMYATDVHTGVSVEHRAGDRFAMCSTFKTYAAARVLQLSAEGDLPADTSIPIEESDIVENSPVTSTLTGRSMTLD